MAKASFFVHLFPEFLEPRRAAEKTVAAVKQASNVQSVSKSHVSRLCGEIDERVDAFLNCSLEGERS